MFSRLQKLRKRVRAKEYPEMVEAERLFWRDLSSKLRVLADKERLMGIRGRGEGGLKRRFLRAWALVGKGLKGRVLECFSGLLLAEDKGSPQE
jgi:hypothetical protein